MKNSFLLKFLIKRSSLPKGFTLTELLIAVILAGIVVAAATGGLVTLLNFNRESELDTQRRIELNRALEYIADEIRMASEVESVTVQYLSGQTAPGLKLRIPSDTTQPYRIYVVRPNTGTWITPNTINRATGTYTTSPYNVTGGNIALIDGITTPSSPPSCPGTNGFYACVGSDARTVDLYLYGRLKSGETYEASSKVFARSN